MSTWIPSAEAFGTPTVQSAVVPAGVPSGEAFGIPAVTASSIIDVHPTGIPSAEAFGVSREAIVLGVVGIASGEVVPGPIVKSTVTSVLSSGNLSGSSVLAIPVQFASGTIVGTSTLVDPAIIVRHASGFIHGVGKLSGHFPDPLVGASVLVGELVVVQAPPPVCGCITPKPVTVYRCSCGGTIPAPAPEICTCSGKTGGDGFGFGGPLYWNQFFQSGDLTFFLRDSFGPVIPNSVSYTLFWIRNGVPFQAGPANRVPGRGPEVGRFYVTGRVGEFGQPGRWLVRWRYQRFFFSEINEVEFRFVVQDAVATANPRDLTRRVLKYGWD